MTAQHYDERLEKLYELVYDLDDIQVIENLKRLGVEFDQDKDGKELYPSMDTLRERLVQQLYWKESENY